jgi:hypothetical protein
VVFAGRLQNGRPSFHPPVIWFEEREGHTMRNRSNTPEYESNGVAVTVVDMHVQWQEGLHKDSIPKIFLLCLLSPSHVDYLFSYKITPLNPFSLVFLLS